MQILKKIHKNQTLCSNKGVTIIELLVTLAIISIVGVVIYTAFINISQGSTQERVRADVQQKARLAVEIMARDLRMLGLDPTGSAKAGFVSATLLPNEIHFTMDLNNDKKLDGEFENIRYYVNPDTNALHMATLIGTPTAVAVDDVLLNNVVGLSFLYYDRNSNITTDPNDVVFIEINLTLTSQSRKPIEVGFSTVARLRNRGNS